jgi:hypothetical protein
MQFANHEHNYDRQRSQGAISRRSLLKRIAGVTALGFFLPSLIAACGNESTTTTSSADGVQIAPEEPCAENEAIPPVAIAARTAVAYVDVAPHAERRCDNCRFFKPPAAGASCGGCEIVGGPIAPAGYCTAWVAE